MTFKHVKFEDSVVMRSLEKVAREKSLLKEEDFIKKASKSIDLSPTPVLFVNLLKLAAGLRNKGWDDAAVELENKAIAYKQAQTLYETSKEKGEDLIDAAHPKGSHKLEGVEGDALFETIIDQHLADLEVVQKKPTGKLASSRDILKAVRVVLGQDASAPSAPTEEKIVEIAGQASNIVAAIGKLVNDELTISINTFISKAAELATNPTVYNLNKFKELLKRLYKRLNPSFSAKWTMLGFGGVSDYTWNRVQPLLIRADSLLDVAHRMRVRLDAIEQKKLEGKPAEEAPKPQDVTKPQDATKTQFINRIKTLNSELNRAEAVIKNKVPVPYQEKAKGHINNWKEQVKAEYNFIDSQETAEDLAAKKNDIDRRLSNLEDWLKEFKIKWLGEA